MDSARKKYVNIERLSSGDIFALLDATESDDEGDIENIMIDSDAESVISTNIIRKEEIGDQSSSVSVPEALIHILSTQNEDKTDTLGQDEPNSAPATQHTFNQSPSLANQHTPNQSPAAAATQCTSNQSPAAVTQCIADQSPAAVVTSHTSDQSSSYCYSTPKHQEMEAKLDD